MKPIMQFLYRARRLLLRLTGWKTRGVKVMVFNQAGELLLVRHSYGRSDLFLLPGGGIEARETPAAAAHRELREEVGLSTDELKPFATYCSTSEGRKDEVHLFTATTTGVPKADGVELEDACFFPLGALPKKVSPATLRRIAEYRGEKPVSPRW